MNKPPLITLLTDFGLTDHYGAAMKGVILTICPKAQIVDISHDVRSYAIESAAFVLAQAYPCFPKGSIHVAVVDPGVGSERRPLLLESDGHYFIAPDNGVLTLAMDRDKRHKGREINATRYFRKPVSNTFHGRDIFAPVAAHLANGVSPSKIGNRARDWVRLVWTMPSLADHQNAHWKGRIIHIDKFGNIVTSFTTRHLRAIKRKEYFIQIDGTTVTARSRSYSDFPKGQLTAIVGSSGYLEVSLNQGDAATVIGAGLGDPVTLG